MLSPRNNIIILVGSAGLVSGGNLDPDVPFDNMTWEQYDHWCRTKPLLTWPEYDNCYSDAMDARRAKIKDANIRAANAAAENKKSQIVYICLWTTHTLPPSLITQVKKSSVIGLA